MFLQPNLLASRFVSGILGPDHYDHSSLCSESLQNLNERLTAYVCKVRNFLEVRT